MKSMYGDSVRFKPVEQIEKEVETIYALGYRAVYFIDLEFTLDRSRILSVCEMIRRFHMDWCCQTRVDAVDPELLKVMAYSGCRLIHYGIESGVPETIRRIRKKTSIAEMENAVRWTKSARMATAGFFLFGFPWETKDSWRETELLARKLNMTYASFHFMTPYAGTEAVSSAGEARPWWMQEELNDAQKRALRLAHLRYCLRPSYARELLLNGRNRLAAFRLFLGFLRSFIS
jgi:anaerobic magnesium-protoporphyrin IX monomethyl ester cyclase